jgi:formylglycine-generating enzyme required for sulfatase activity
MTRIIACCQAFFLMLTYLSACGDGSVPSDDDLVTPREKGVAPPTVVVQGGRMTVGFATGTIRKSTQLHSYRVTAGPVTASDYMECVAAGACEERGQDCIPDDQVEMWSSSEAPALCVSPNQVAAYCEWIDGQIPTLEEWLLAGRGAEVQVYPWGDTEANCEKHPFWDRRGVPCNTPEGGESQVAPIKIGERLAGNSPAGLTDVLLTSAELVRGAPDGAFGACRQSTPCLVVSGFFPGSIGATAPLKTDENEHKVNQMYAFRCAWILEQA